MIFLSNPPLCDNCKTEVADPSHYEDSWNNVGVQGDDGVYCSHKCRKEAEDSIEFPISIDEVMGQRSISLTTSISWTDLSGVKNKGFIPSGDLLEEVKEEAIKRLSKDLEDYDLGEYDSMDIGKAEIIPDDQELVSVEVSVE